VSYEHVKRWFKPLASLRLTVVLFVLAMFLIFAGTLAQVHHGIYEVTRLYFHSLFVWIPLNIFIPDTIASPPGFIPFPGGYAIGALLLLNLVAAHISRFKLGWKRIGMWMIHTGIIMLMLGELVTGLVAYEGNMTIDQGSSSNFTENLHKTELAIIDESDAKVDKVMTVSQQALRQASWTQEPIVDKRLPFAVQVDQWMPNSLIYGPAMAPPGLKPLADTGIGTQALAQSVDPVTGVDASSINAPAAVITFLDQGKPLGRYLVSLNLDQPQAVHVGDRTYQVSLRLERHYKPYTLHLIEFKHDLFTGTNTPRNFSSLVQLIDPSQHEDRQVRIWMNHPLRYNGETFYQSSYKPDNSGTILQVVDNPSWMMPYLSCAVIVLGMLIHFGIHLVSFIRRSQR
jgi:hypothetical protein